MHEDLDRELVRERYEYRVRRYTSEDLGRELGRERTRCYKHTTYAYIASTTVQHYNVLILLLASHL